MALSVKSWRILGSIGIVIVVAAAVVVGLLFMQSPSSDEERKDEATAETERVPDSTSYQLLTSRSADNLEAGDVELVLREYDEFIAAEDPSNEVRAGYLIDRVYLFITSSRAADYEEYAYADVYEAESLNPTAASAWAVYDVAVVYGDDAISLEYEALYEERLEEYEGE